MEKSKYAAIVHFLMRQKQYLEVLRTKDNALVLNTMNYADEIRDFKDFNLPIEKSNVPSKELALASQLIESLSGHFKPGEFKDEDRAKMLKTLKSLAKGHTVRVATDSKSKKTTNVVDIMSRLEQSLKKKSAVKANNSTKKTAPKRAARG